MSTFTDWNGPQCNNSQGQAPSTRSIIDLIDAYNTVLSTLESHINATVSDDNNVHNVKEYVTAKLNALQNTLDSASTNASEAIADIRGEVTNAYLTALRLKFTGEAASMVDTQSNVNNNIISMMYKLWVLVNAAATKEQVNTVSDTLDSLSDKIGNVPQDENIISLINDINAALDSENTGVLARLSAIETSLEAHTFDNITVTDTTTSKSVETKYIKNEISRIVYDPNESQLQRLFLGVSGEGDATRYWHILGMLSDNAGTAYVKFTDTQNLAAIINFAVNDSHAGIINVSVARVPDEWLDTSFAICRATDADSNVHYYLCIARGNLSENQMLAFKPSVSGINFVSPMLENKYIEPVSNGTATVVAQVDLSDFVACEAITGSTDGTDAATDGIKVGFGIRWPGVGNPPDKYIEANGQTVSRTDYPQLAKAWGIQTDTFVIPAEDYTIFKYEA